jgi:K+-sensing histidine kinase KdpD
VGVAERQVERVLEIQSMLARTSREVGAALELQPVVQTVLAAMRSLVDFRGGTICLLDEDGAVYVAASDPPVSPEVEAARVPIGTGLSGRVIGGNAAVYSPNVDEDERVDPALRGLGSNSGMKSYLAVPLSCLGRVIGLMQVDSEEEDAFDESDLAVLEGLAVQVAGAIESARRYEHVMELERLKSDFIGRVSHELRTPLTIVGGFTDTLLALGDSVGEAERRRMLERVRAATTRLQTLVEEVVTIAGYEAGVIAPHPRLVVLSELLGEVRSACADPDAVVVRCPPDMRVVTDPKLLRHALSLLVDNALRYAGDAELVPAIEAATGDTVIDVLDHGFGVPAHIRDRAFERFVRGDDSMPGMGLGLPIARMLATGCGARLELLHRPAGGALFRLRFA